MSKTIIITGGGTGGHLYPALSVAAELNKLDPSIKIHFVGSPYGIEARIMPQYKYPLHLVPVGGMNQKSILEKLKVLFLLPIAFVKCVFLILKLKPSFVFGFGGYSSAPMMVVAGLFRIPSALFESNAMPGITNRMVSGLVKTSFVTFDEAKKFLKSKNVLTVGFPVRSEMQPSPREPSPRFRILIFGGSQGARGINMTVSEAIQSGGDWAENVDFIHQTGRWDFHTVNERYKKSNNVKAIEYLDPIKKYYDWADLIFCRAGAGTIAEVSACGKAVVLIPFPLAADNHQQKNAEKLVLMDAAIMCLQKEFTTEYFKVAVQKFKANPQLLRSLELNIKKFHRENVALNMARYIRENLA